MNKKKVVILSISIFIVATLIVLCLINIHTKGFPKNDEILNNPNIQNFTIPDNKKEIIPIINDEGIDDKKSSGGGGNSGGGNGGEEINFISKEFDVNISIDSSTEIFAVELYVYFDNSILEAINSSEGDFLNKDGALTYQIIDINNDLGYIRFANSRIDTTNSVEGFGSLIIITFKTIADGSTDLELQKVSIVDYDINLIKNFTINNGAVNSASNNVEFTGGKIII